MKTIRVVDFRAFDTILSSTLATAPGRVFVMTFGTEEHETGESWCPDSRVGMPLIRSAVERVSNAILIECPTGSRSEWKDPDNFYRRHKTLKAERVPTLYELDTADGTVLGTLVEKQVTNENLERFLNGSAVMPQISVVILRVTAFMTVALVLTSGILWWR